jgi:hypothetical protein
MNSLRISEREKKVADKLVEYADTRVSLEQLAARMGYTWPEFSAAYTRLRALAEAETVSQVIAWWRRRRIQ